MVALASTLISSIALVGVAAGLFLQAKQLQLGRVQAFRATQAELIKMTVDNPDTSFFYSQSSADPQVVRRYLVMTWRLRHLEFGYLLGEMSADGIRSELDPI